MSEFIGLRPKMYSIIYNVKSKDKSGTVVVNKVTAKGITKTAKEKQLRHEHFRRSLFENEKTTHKMTVIRSENHKLYLDSVI